MPFPNTHLRYLLSLGARILARYSPEEARVAHQDVQPGSVPSIAKTQDALYDSYISISQSARNRDGTRSCVTITNLSENVPRAWYFGPEPAAIHICDVVIRVHGPIVRMEIVAEYIRNIKAGVA